MAIDRATDTRIKNIEVFIKGNIRDIQANSTQKTNIQLTPNGLGFYTILENSLGGVELALNGKSFLLVGQTNPAENGLYVITALGPNTITRSTDFTTYQQIYNTRIQIVEGDYAGNWYQSSTTEPFTIDTTPITIVDTDQALENLQSAVANLNANINNVYTKTEVDTALNLKENTITEGTTSQYFRGDKTWQPLNKSVVGLSSVNNTSDLSKPISTATQTALDLKANSSNVYTKTETYNKAEVDSKIPLVGINFATFSTSFGTNITLNAGSNTPVNITDDIFATASLSPSFANVFSYSGGVLFVKNTIRNIEINFDVIVSLLYNGGQNSQFEVRIVNASTGTKVIARQFNQTSSLQSTQVQRVAQILPLTLPATELGNNYMQTVGFKIEVISGSTAVAVTIIGIEPSVRQVSSYQ